MPSGNTRLFALLLVLPLLAQEKTTDYSLVHQIRQEAYEHSQVMDTLAFLTDRYGPRLAASPEFDEAADWTLKRLTSWGLANAHAETWGLSAAPGRSNTSPWR